MTPMQASGLAAKEARRLAVVDAAAKVLVLKGHGPHARATEVNRLLPRADRLHSDNALRAATGGWTNLLVRMSQGGLFPPGSLGQWSEGLFVGLRVSGALQQLKVGSRVRAAMWAVSPLGLRPALELVLMDGFPFSGVARVADHEVICYRLWAGNLGVVDAGGADVVAGLLMGAIPVGHSGRSWLGVPSTPEARGLLESWGIPVGLSGHLVARRRRVDLVSPFWGALFGRLMPGGMLEWYLGMPKPGMCPLLPWAFLRMAGGRVSDDGVGKVDRRMVPFLVNRDALYAAGVPLKGVHERAVRDLGMARVDPRLRVVWKGYVEGMGMAFPFR